MPMARACERKRDAVRELVGQDLEEKDRLMHLEK